MFHTLLICGNKLNIYAFVACHIKKSFALQSDISYNLIKRETEMFITILVIILTVIIWKAICHYIDKHDGWGCGDQWGNPFG